MVMTLLGNGAFLASAALLCVYANLSPLEIALIMWIAFVITIPFFMSNLVRPWYPVHEGGIILVTGASTGIGKDAALYLGKQVCTFRERQRLTTYYFLPLGLEVDDQISITIIIIMTALSSPQ